MNTWKQSIVCGNYPLDKTFTSLVCPMITFGHNSATMNAQEGHPYPSWVPYGCGYIGAYVLGVVCVVSYFPQFFPGITDATVSALAQLQGSLCLGVYAGHQRSRIREKYNIEGNSYSDCIMHSFLSPCALCQESYEIDYQTMHNASSQCFTDAPYIPVMVRE